MFPIKLYVCNSIKDIIHEHVYYGILIRIYWTSDFSKAASSFKSFIVRFVWKPVILNRCTFWLFVSKEIHIPICKVIYPK